MLDGNSPLWQHKLQNGCLILLSLAFLPIDTLVVGICNFYNLIVHSEVQRLRSHSQAQPNFRHRTILVTGVGMTKGLVLARLFHASGHTVIGADFEPSGALVSGRFSNSISKFFPLTKPSPSTGSSHYIEDLLSVIIKHKIDLWVSCSGVASAVEDGEAKEIIEARTPCKAVQFDVNTTQILHEKHTFIQHASSLGLNVPETHAITTPSAVKDVLATAPRGRKYIMKTIGVVDAVRGDMTLLPKSTPEETSAHISRLPISNEVSWILQQHIAGSEYCTHALVVKGEVKAFVACPSSELLMHYEALPSSSPLSKAMLSFTETFAKHGGEDFTGHLSFDFLVETNPHPSSSSQRDNEDIILYPIECNPRAHTAVVLFNPPSSPQASEMVNAYLSLLSNTQHSNPTSNSTQEPALPTTSSGIISPSTKRRYHWLPHDLIVYILLPTLNLLFPFSSFSSDHAAPTAYPASSFSNVLQSYLTFTSYLLHYHDGTFSFDDPIPWWWLCHVYWPMRFLNYFRMGEQGKWSRLNVSTGKVFEC